MNKTHIIHTSTERNQIQQRIQYWKKECSSFLWVFPFYRKPDNVFHVFKHFQPPISSIIFFLLYLSAINCVPLFISKCLQKQTQCYNTLKLNWKLFTVQPSTPLNKKIMKLFDYMFVLLFIFDCIRVRCWYIIFLYRFMYEFSYEQWTFLCVHSRMIIYMIYEIQD